MDLPEAPGPKGPVLPANAPAATQPPAVPDHALLRLIGRGSYGEVWLARSVLGALRAVKVVYRSRFRDARPYEREFSGILHIEPLSRTNEGLVDILHVGRHEPEGYYYYVMELADDAADPEGLRLGKALSIPDYQPRTLARELKGRARLPFEECLQLGLSLASALHHLHQNNLIHRDVKPSNILYVKGVPKLGDIGLVGETGETGSYVGTEGYIPPEGPGNPQADIFGLGKVLYEASTGLDRLSFPRLPATLGDGTARSQLAELNAILIRACATAPQDRYKSAEELLADLSLLHRGQSVRRQHRRAQRWRRAQVAGYLLAALLGLGAGTLWSPRQRTPVASPSPRPTASRPASYQPVDLSPFFNAALSDSWLRDLEGNNLANLPTGSNFFGSMVFNVQGLIQLAGSYTQDKKLVFPGEIKGIPVNHQCEQIHFLHGAAWRAEEGELVARYVVHYVDNHEEAIRVRYGLEVRNWWWDSQYPLNATLAKAAWTGTNAVTTPGTQLCLYKLTWHNPRPEVAIRSFDFISARATSSPFLVAVTTESPD